MESKATAVSPTRRTRHAVKLDPDLVKAALTSRLQAETMTGLSIRADLDTLAEAFATFGLTRAYLDGLEQRLKQALTHADPAPMAALRAEIDRAMPLLPRLESLARRTDVIVGLTGQRRVSDEQRQAAAEAEATTLRDRTVGTASDAAALAAGIRAWGDELTRLEFSVIELNEYPLILDRMGPKVRAEFDSLLADYGRAPLTRHPIYEAYGARAFTTEPLHVRGQALLADLAVLRAHLVTVARVDEAIATVRSPKKAKALRSARLDLVERDLSAEDLATRLADLDQDSQKQQ